MSRESAEIALSLILVKGGGFLEKLAGSNGEYHFRTKQGETWVQPITWKNADGSPKNLTDYTILWQIRPSATSSTITVTGDYEIYDAEKGMFSLILTEEQSSSIPTKGHDYSQLSKYVYDVYVISPQGASTRILNGFIFVSPGVSKSAE
ncbi:MAG: hypothetical protein H6Q67_1954 [Firmicutes bacterium]|nr:hypothetical protein [Bacillota bacterium]